MDEQIRKLETENEALKSKLKTYKALNEQLRIEIQDLKTECLELKKEKLNGGLHDLEEDLEEDSLPSISSSLSSPDVTHEVRNSIGAVNLAEPRVKAAVISPLNDASSLRSQDLTSVEVNQAAEYFAQSTGVSTSPAVKTSVASVLSTAKLEKSNRTYKEHNKALLEENKNVRDECTRLRNANSQLMKKVTQLQQDREQTEDSLLSSTSSNGWVTVDPHKNISYSEDNEQTKLVQAAPLTNDIVIAQYKRHIDQLKDANKKWEEHFKKTQEEFSRQLGYIEKEKDDLTRQIGELQSAEEKRQIEIDRILLTAKKRYQDEETQKEDALQELHMVNVQKEQLQKQLHALENQRQQREGMQTAPAQFEQGHLDANVYALHEEIAVLKQQITTYQEDFENERRDRERIQQLKEQYKEMLDNAKVDKANVDRQLDMQNRTLEHLRRMKQEVEYDLGVARRELMDLRRTGINQPPPAPGPVNMFGMPNWSCQHCTFSNPGQRTSCEICGSPKNPIPSRPLAFQTARVVVDQSRQGIGQGRDVPDGNQRGRVNGQYVDDLTCDNGGFP